MCCFSAKGYITVKVLRDILHELDEKIPPGDLDLMIDEIDADGSGTVDFEGESTKMNSQCSAFSIGRRWFIESNLIVFFFFCSFSPINFRIHVRDDR